MNPAPKRRARAEERRIYAIYAARRIQEPDFWRRTKLMNEPDSTRQERKGRKAEKKSDFLPLPFQDLCVLRALGVKKAFSHSGMIGRHPS
jgi:hypothetical protein